MAAIQRHAKTVWLEGGTGKAGRDVAAAGALLFVVGLCAGMSGCANGNGRPWIHRIWVHGNKQVKTGDIRGKLAIQQQSLIPFAPHHYLEHPYVIEVERERIETYYHARGYFSAKVTKAETTQYKTGKKPAVDVHFTVEEGQPTHIRNINIGGLEEIGQDGEKIRDRIGKLEALRPGRIFEHPEYVLSKDLVQRLIQLRGYAFVKLNWEVDVDRDNRTADVVLNIDPGKKMHIGNTIVDGTHQVAPEAVAKHAALFYGDAFRPDLLDGAQGKLYNLGIFDTVLVEPVQSKTDPYAADVRIRVAEGKFRELDLGIGFGIEPLRTEVHGEATFIKRSFLGGIRKLEISAKPGYAAVPAFWSSDLYRHGPLFTLRVDFTQPDLLGKNSEFRAGIIYDLGLDYAYQYHGPATKIGVQKQFWRDHIKLGLSYNFQFLDFFATDPAILADPGSAGALYGYVDPYRLGYLQEQFVLDLRNRPIDANRGFYLAVQAEEGGVYTGSAFNYQKIVPEVRGYVPIGERVTIAARIMYGRIFTQGDLGSPITQRLFLGGPNSHRGFTYNRLSPQVCSALVDDLTPPDKLITRTDPMTGMMYPNRQKQIPVKVSCLSDPNLPGVDNFRRLPIGGDQMLLAQLELRLNLFKLAGQWVSMAGFVDAGDVSAPASASCEGQGCTKLNYNDSIDIKNLHVAVGGGLRYRTVIGAIRLDLGYRLNRTSMYENQIENPDPDSRFAYHISIGESF